MNLKLKRTPGIYLVGFMGSGKSTIGRMFADEIGWRFGDLDDDIEHMEKKTISELFASVGEQRFRQIESEAIRQRVASIRRGIPTVLSLGGGAFTSEENIELLQENGITVWIDTALEIVQRRCSGSTHRPLARDPERFVRLYGERRSAYARAQYHIPLLVDDSRVGLRALHELCLLD